MAFPFLTIFIVFIILLSLRYAYLKKRQQEKFDAFTQREAAAERAPAVDLSTLSYLTVPLERFPFGKWAEDEVTMLEEAIRQVAKKPLLNLTGKTNTDLKLEYGAKNLEAMSAIGESFNELTVLLVDYAKALMEKSDYEGATAVLEYGVSIGTDISTNYTLLGDCYMERHLTEKLAALKEQVPSLHLPLEQKVLDYLDRLSAS